MGYYRFGYDGLSRITKADYLINGTTSNNYKVPAITYDKHGNITSLERWGKTTTEATYGMVDKFTMTYHGNQLIKVTDSGVNVSMPESGDFKDGSNVATEYTYNKNGAIKQDEEVKNKAPKTIISRPNGMVKDWQSNFEKVSYDLKIDIEHKSISLIDTFLLGLYLGAITYVIGLLIFIFLLYRSNRNMKRKTLITVGFTQFFLSFFLSIIVWRFWIFNIDIIYGFLFMPALYVEIISIFILLFGMRKCKINKN